MPLKFNSNVISETSGTVTFNGNNVNKIVLDNTTIWEKSTVPSGVTLVGNCQLNNGILTNFSNSDYAIPTYSFAPNTISQSFEISIKFTVNNISSAPNQIIYHNGFVSTGWQNGEIMIGVASSNRLAFDIRNQSKAFYASPSYTFVNNTTYYAKYIYDKSYLYVYLKESEILDSDSPITTVAVSNNDKCDCSNLVNPYIGVTNEVSSYSPWQGAIDLSYWQFKIDGQIVWKGI